MPEKKDSGFTVTDRRLFNADGELRADVPPESGQEKADSQPSVEKGQPTAAAPPPSTPPSSTLEDMPPTPSAAEQQAQRDAYEQSSKDMDARVELSGHSAKDLEMTFERFVASLYMTAMLQLGLMHEEGGQPRIDLIGARQTIDTLGLMSEKTKGNLSSSRSPTRWLVRRKLRRQRPKLDESYAHRAGQRHLDGGAYHRLRLRRMPLLRPARSPHPPVHHDPIRWLGGSHRHHP
jgi:hypothetical protein